MEALSLREPMPARVLYFYQVSSGCNGPEGGVGPFEGGLDPRSAAKSATASSIPPC